MDRSLYSCGLDAAVDVIGGKWKALILWELHTGVRRFGQLRRGLAGISEKMLIQQLRELESDGIVHREVYREVPPRVEYSLTELGASLNTALLPLGDWGEEHMLTIVARRSTAAAPAGPPEASERHSRPSTLAESAVRSAGEGAPSG